ncbi:MAG: hypothetical protein FWH10_04010 [Oscillospiraceae bacterium]|nr:hypothetical protein [Oscillospiraceae bacterium]
MNELRVIIVTGGGYESEYARKLNALLSEKGITSALWTENEYLSNRPKISNKAHLVFFGLGRETKKQEAIIRSWAFDSYACRIGWLGKTCVITAWDGSLPWDDLKAFSNYCELVAKNHPDIVIPSDKSSGELWNVVKGIFTDIENRSVWRAQYSMLVYEFIDNCLNDFMGIKLNGEGEDG